MKRDLLNLGIFAIPLLAATTATAAPNAIERVVVHPDRAVVTRRLDVACTGRTVATFQGLPPASDPATFRADALRAHVDGVRWRLVKHAETFGPQAEKLTRELQQQEKAGQLAAEALERLETEEALLDKLMETTQAAVGQQLAGAKDSANWVAAAETLLQKKLALLKERGTQEALQAKAEARQDDLKRALVPLQSATAKTTYDADVLFTCASGTATVTLSYVVGGAGWAPAYQARADEASKSVHLTTLGIVHQATGENWGGAIISLSTAVPAGEVTIPKVSPLLVSASEREAPVPRIEERSEDDGHSAGAAHTATNEKTGSGLRAVTNDLFVEMQVPDPLPIPGDGRDVQLHLAEQDLPATFRWQATPKINNGVFRVASLSNAGALPLLPGPAELFRGNAFVARQDLVLVPQRANFELVFGNDDLMSARRARVDLTPDEIKRLGDPGRHHHLYELKVANHQAQPVELDLSDHIPVSELDDVSVKLDNLTTPGGTISPADGRVTWKLRLSPGEERLVRLSFAIHVPKEYEE